MPETSTCETSLTLLALPAEIRSNIWSILLSHQGIHVEAGEKKLCDHENCCATACPSSFKWIWYVCTNLGTRLQLHRWFRSSDHFVPENEHRKWEHTASLDDHGWFRCDEHFGHSTCGVTNGMHRYGEDGLTIELRHNIASLFHVCRSVSAEATRILYNTNTFTFRNEKDVAKWMSERTTRQRQQLGGMEVMVGYMPLRPTHIYGDPMWNDIFSPNVIEELTQLTRLHICLVEEDGFMRKGLHESEYLDFGEFINGNSTVMHKVLDINDLLRCFSRLKTSPLREVTSVVACCRFFGEFQRILPTQSQRRTLADHFISAVQGDTIETISNVFAPQIDQPLEIELENSEDHEDGEEWDDSVEEEGEQGGRSTAEAEVRENAIERCYCCTHGLDINNTRNTFEKWQQRVTDMS